MHHILYSLVSIPEKNCNFGTLRNFKLYQQYNYQLLLPHTLETNISVLITGMSSFPAYFLVILKCFSNCLTCLTLYINKSLITQKCSNFIAPAFKLLLSEVWVHIFYLPDPSNAWGRNRVLCMHILEDNYNRTYISQQEILFWILIKNKEIAKQKVYFNF